MPISRLIGTFLWQEWNGHTWFFGGVLPTPAHGSQRAVFQVTERPSMCLVGPLWTGLSCATLNYCGIDCGESCELQTAVNIWPPWISLLPIPLNSRVENRSLSQLCWKFANTCCVEQWGVRLSNPRVLGDTRTAPRPLHWDIFCKMTHCSSYYILLCGPAARPWSFFLMKLIYIVLWAESKQQMGSMWIGLSWLTLPLAQESI